MIGARDKSVGGSVLDTEQFRENPDLTFIPGYSDKRRQIDYELGHGLEPSVALTHRYQFLTTTKVNGQAARQKVMQYKAQRYERVMVDMLDGLGIEMPLGAEKTADGGIRLGDTELYYCSAEVAAGNEAKLHSASESQEADDTTASALHTQGQEFDRSGNLTTAKTTRKVEVSPR